MSRENNIDWNRKIGVLTFTNDMLEETSLKTAKNYIYAIDFSLIEYKITKPDPNIARLWDKASALKVIHYYRNYLWLLRKYAFYHPVLPPSVDMDEIWHHHILDTYKYHDDCQAIFGQYLHHYPYFGMRGEADYQQLQQHFSLTQQLHFREFGEYIESFSEEEGVINLELYS